MQLEQQKQTHTRIAITSQISTERNKKQGETEIRDHQRRSMLFILTFDARVEDPKTEPIGVVVGVGEIVDVQHCLRPIISPHFFNQEEGLNFTTTPPDRTQKFRFRGSVICLCARLGVKKKTPPEETGEVRNSKKRENLPFFSTCRAWEGFAATMYPMRNIKLVHWQKLIAIK